MNYILSFDADVVLLNHWPTKPEVLEHVASYDLVVVMSRRQWYPFDSNPAVRASVVWFPLESRDLGMFAGEMPNVLAKNGICSLIKGYSPVILDHFHLPQALWDQAYSGCSRVVVSPGYEVKSYRDFFYEDAEPWHKRREVRLFDSIYSVDMIESIKRQTNLSSLSSAGTLGEYFGLLKRSKVVAVGHTANANRPRYSTGQIIADAVMMKSLVFAHPSRGFARVLCPPLTRFLGNVDFLEKVKLVLGSETLQKLVIEEQERRMKLLGAKTSLFHLMLEISAEHPFEPV